MSNYDVLITYNSADENDVRKIVRLLENKGYNLWFDKNILGGLSWQENFYDATKVVKCVVAFFGKMGVGRWQNDELALLKEYRVEAREIRLIPVLLPGVSDVPDNARPIFPGITKTYLEEIKKPEEGSYEIKGLGGTLREIDIAPLEGAIRNALKSWKKYPFEIEIDVPEASKSCFLAMSKDGLGDIYKVIKEVIENIDCELRLQRRSSPESALKLVQTRDNLDKVTFDNDIVRSIRASSLVIAVCTPQDSTSTPCPEVVYELGMAHALGKPSILVTTNQRIREQIPAWSERVIPTVEFVEYSPDDIHHSLLHALQDAVRRKVGQIKKPFLVDPNIDGIRVIRSDLASMRSDLWPHFRTIISFGIRTLNDFSNLTKRSHALLTDINSLAETVKEEAGKGYKPPEHSAAFGPQQLAFQKCYKDLSDLHTKWEESYYKKLLAWKPVLTKTFNFLNKHLDADLCKLIYESQKWYEGVVEGGRCHVEVYREFYNLINKNVPDEFNCLEEWIEAGQLRTQVEQLDQALNFSVNSIHNMMNKLLEVIVEDQKYEKHSATDFGY